MEEFGLLSDQEIARLALEEGMLVPFEPRQVRVAKEIPLVSHGLSSFGYDMRVGYEFRIFTPSTGNLSYIDPKNFDHSLLYTYRGSHCFIPPHSFALASSMEHFRIPEDVLAICLGKSTYARCGCIVNVTPFEPGWRGFVTIEISNTTPLPLKVYGGEGIAQVLFFRGKRPQVTYADRKGKYQDQPGIEPAKV